MYWDPQHYLTYADERSRPFFDLLAQVPARDPDLVVDLGCGAGNLTHQLVRRWPEARVLGIDSSPEMIADARASQPPEFSAPTVHFEVADLTSWQPPDPVSVLICNAVLQWVPRHLELLPKLMSWLAPEGWLAFQVPANFDQPSHAICAELARSPRYAGYTDTVTSPHSWAPQTYLTALSEYGHVGAWHTTYLHVLSGADPVFEWVSATGVKPTLLALPLPLRAEFETELKRRLKLAYPAIETPGTDSKERVVFPFTRVFVVVQAGPGLAAPDH